jgi:EAL domain-containing protein (putative c-di-GMP-specific phosphodiesterase class I)/DNA-binding response OmpR family regulator
VTGRVALVLEPAPPSLPGPNRPSVLVIDDDPMLREVYAQALRRAGFKLILAPDGETGLALVAAHPIGLVLCDVSMPGISGFDVVRSLRARPETATLPVILFTGLGDQDSVIEGLAAGADDFLPRPVRLIELIARVRAHIRIHDAWLDVVQDELRARVDVVATLARIQPSSDPEVVAQAIITQLAERTDAGYVGVYQVTPDQRGRILANTLPHNGDDQMVAPTPRRMQYLIERARVGPWTEDVGVPEPGEPTSAFWEAGFGLSANAPICSGEELVGILIMAQRASKEGPLGPRGRGLMLATVIDYAAVLGAAVGSTLSARGESQLAESRLRQILERQEFDIAFQPIVELKSRTVVGYEALCRFDDGVVPDRRFAEAFAAGLGADFELAAVALAAERAAGLPEGVFVSINVSPDVLVEATERLREALPQDRQTVLEVTEHVQILDYRRLRAAVESLDCWGLAVDDAGAGYASLRHILELKPAYAKLDLSLVQGIDQDEVRQSLAAGLVHVANRSGFRLIAEGIENEADAECLEELGVGLGQGYLFGRPAVLT